MKGSEQRKREIEKNKLGEKERKEFNKKGRKLLNELEKKKKERKGNEK